MRIGVGAVLVQALMEIDPRFPAVSKQQRQALLEVKEALKAQAPKGAAPDPFEQQRHNGKPDEGRPRDGRDEPQAAAATNAEREP